VDSGHTEGACAFADTHADVHALGAVDGAGEPLEGAALFQTRRRVTL
jgi:hypothetical protein